MKYLFYFCCISLLLGCASMKETPKEQIKTDLKDNYTFLITEVSDDNSYGYSEKNPIEVGGVDVEEGPLNERRFLNALAGPNGEKVSYFRDGSCCAIKSDMDPFGFGYVMLDNYRVSYEGSDDTVSIYINMYDYGVLKAPKGFTIKVDGSNSK